MIQDTFIVAINAGSSSIKARLFMQKEFKQLLAIHIEKTKGASYYNLATILFDEDKKHTEQISLTTIREGIEFIFDKIHIIAHINDIAIVGHRVVHGGEYYATPTIITNNVLERIRLLGDLAPLHNPINHAAILVAQHICPQAHHVAIFDTAFHQTIPKEAYLYGLPIELYKKYKIRKYGFHGISHQNVANEIKKRNPKAKKIISCHLGNGCSITAIKDGKSVDTSMGFTPVDGIMMGTRSGSFDPEIILYLLRHKHLSPKEIDEIINNGSGFKGITKTSDMREMHLRDLKGDKTADLGIDMFVYDIIQYIGAYIAALNGIDAIAFTGGIGEQAWYIRKQILDSLSYFGIKTDEKKNKKNEEAIHQKTSKVKLYVVKANEELSIAQQAQNMVKTVMRK